MAMRMRERRMLGLVASRFRLPAFFLSIALAYGTVGYAVIEGFSVLDSLYLTVQTLTTVGFGDIGPLGVGGKLFTISLIALGLVAFFDLIASFTALLASGELADTYRRRRMSQRIDQLRDHYIVCAYGRVGRAAANELLDEGAAIVVIDVKSELEPLMQAADVPYLVADPTHEAVLREAGIDRARGLVCAVDSDADNVFITLTARSLNPGIFIAARASAPETVDTLERAGANRVVSPYVLSGTRMAALVMRPAVVDFVDMVTVAPDLRLEEIMVEAGSGIEGSSVKDAQTTYEGVVVLALRKAGGELIISPPADAPFEPGDLVIALGPVASLSKMAQLAQ